MRTAIRGSALRASVAAARYGYPLPPGPRMVVSVIQLPPPTGGWNARDALQAMQPTDAIELDNYIVDEGGIVLREGHSEHATDLGGPVETIMEYNSPSGTVKMFAAANNTIWDVTSAGAGVSSVTSMNNDRWQYTMFAVTAGTNYLVAVNGEDDVRAHDGSSWSTPILTGVTSSQLINVAVHLDRLWFVQDNTLDAWYLPVKAITGTVTKLPVGPFCTLGGELLAVASWTRDGGAGMDDLFVAITSKGEAVLYSGTDPASASTWEKIGTFKIPEPVGRRCFTKIGADLALITSVGVVPLSQILPLSAGGAANVAITNKISGAVKRAYSSGSAFFGWQLIEYAKGNILILNVPISDGVTAHQYVMNTQSGAWSRFKGMNAHCWGTKGSDIYWGGNGKVYKYGGRYNDNGSTINATAILAYSNLGTPQNKIVRMARPLLTAATGYLPLLALRSDYDTGVVNYTASSFDSGGAEWDEAEWDIAEWALSSTPTAKWQPVFAEGSVISPAIGVNVTDRVTFNGVDLMIEAGDYL